MFAEINPAYLVASLFFITGGVYLYLTVVTFTGAAELKIRRRYLLTGICLVAYSIFYGLMTITEYEPLKRIFWAGGFTSGFMFFPVWILFLLSVVTIKQKILINLAKVALLLTAVISAICIIANDVVFFPGIYGNQFSYQGSLFFIFAFLYTVVLAVPLVMLQFKWWQEAELTRHRKLAFIFLALGTLASSTGVFTDFMVPIFTNQTITPLGPISIMVASVLTYVRMSAYKKFNITVDNVSGFTFSTLTLPIVILNNTNQIVIENKAAVDLFGETVIGKGISSLIQFNEPEEQTLFESSFSTKTVTAETATGNRICEMLLTVERDKHGDAIWKIVVIRDMTDIIYKDSLLEVLNRVSGILLEPAKYSFEHNFNKAMGMLANAVDVDRVYIWKNHTIYDKLYCSQIYEWSEGAEPVQDSVLAMDVSYEDIMVGLEEHLSNGNSINSIVSEMIPEHKAHLEPQGIISILIVPVFIDDQFWGFVGFDDCRNERIFNENEESILRAASRMIAYSVIRQDMTRKLEVALTDELTGARNRRYFMEIADIELQKSVLENQPFSILMIDVDHFKNVNDTYGHLVGDIVLKFIVERMRHCLKKDTLIARYGGEEFVVMISSATRESVIVTAERVRNNMEENPFRIGNLSLDVTISIGVASLADQSDTLMSIINNADKALYQAKESGRNKVVGYI